MEANVEYQGSQLLPLKQIFNVEYTFLTSIGTLLTSTEVNVFVPGSLFASMELRLHGVRDYGDWWDPIAVPAEGYLYVYV